MLFRTITRAKVAFVAVAAGLLLALTGGIAYASTSGPKPGGECPSRTGDQVTIQTHDGPFKYNCEQRKGETCGHWRIAPGQNPPHRGWPKRPTLPCAGCSPSPSKSTSPSPSKSTSPSPSASPSSSTSPSASTSKSASASTSSSTSTDVDTTPAAVQLPVTGLPTTVLVVIAIGLAMVVGGAGLLIYSLRRRT